MAKLEYDVVIFDSVSSVYDEDSPNVKGIGGSELCVITLSQELAKNGFTVLILNDPVVLKSPDPSPLNPIVAKSGVHYASCRGVLPSISCGTLIGQRSSALPDEIERENTVVWVHDACNNPNDVQVTSLQAATSKGAAAVFVSNWQRSIYPSRAAGRYSMVIPNMLPRLVFDERWQQVPQEDTLVYASAAHRGLNETLKAWSHPGIVASGSTVLEVMGPVYDPPPGSEKEVQVWGDKLEGRVRLCGSLPLPGLLERMAASRGLLYASTWLETFCLVIAYAEAMGKPARYIGLLPGSIAGVNETLTHKKFLYDAHEQQRFLTDLAIELRGKERLTVEPVKRFHPDTIMPLWFDALGLEP